MKIRKEFVKYPSDIALEISLDDGKGTEQMWHWTIKNFMVKH